MAVAALVQQSGEGENRTIRQLGINSRAYAQALADACVQHAETGLKAAAQRPAALPTPRDVLAAAMRGLGTSGAASICVAYLDGWVAAGLALGWGGNVLHVTNAGSTGFVVLRPNTMTGEMEAISDWRPYRERQAGLRGQHLVTEDLKMLVNGCAPAQAAQYCIELAPGDQLILGTHGLFDMVWLHGPMSSNLRKELYTLGYIDRVDPAVIASQLTRLAAQLGSTGQLEGTPLAQQLVAENRAVNTMMDVGDNTAVVAYVVQ
ncbi:protein phosphatase [Haematococcus lacustris]|uniref:Protein phosphatase n=1 Tax=Haematococcus lacustris TaxID=44745 RepID=A0A699YX81_HAELA|nr:protein phosphatase [Haematococcus lacustris]